jgi:tRNA pseudouridine55 synthase
LHGILVVDKPRGWTSHDVVARLRRIAGQRQIGHGGTLDPLATGVLPLGLGFATRLLEYLAEDGKTYEATVRLGTATTTYDAEGAVTAEAPWAQVSEAMLRAALAGFSGTIEQRPPAFSAIKREGRPLYELARRGAAVAVPARTVTIHEIALLRFVPPEIDLRISCSSGTYVRSLAHDLGRALGSVAHLTALRRTRVGSLTLADAITLEELERGGRTALEARLLPPDRAVLSLPAIVLDEVSTRDVCHGRDLRESEVHTPEGSTVSPLSAESARKNEMLCRAYDRAGAFLALLRYDAQHGRWRPHKVFVSAAGGSRAQG